MNLASVIVLLAVALAAILALRKMLRSGKGCSCSSCDGCTQKCSFRRENNINK